VMEPLSLVRNPPQAAGETNDVGSSARSLCSRRPGLGCSWEKIGSVGPTATGLGTDGRKQGEGGGSPGVWRKKERHGGAALWPLLSPWLENGPKNCCRGGREGGSGKAVWLDSSRRCTEGLLKGAQAGVISSKCCHQHLGDMQETEIWSPLENSGFHCSPLVGGDIDYQVKISFNERVRIKIF
jgi:hypothetical protein